MSDITQTALTDVSGLIPGYAFEATSAMTTGPNVSCIPNTGLKYKGVKGGYVQPSADGSWVFYSFYVSPFRMSLLRRSGFMSQACMRLLSFPYNGSGRLFLWNSRRVGSSNGVVRLSETTVGLFPSLCNSRPSPLTVIAFSMRGF